MLPPKAKAYYPRDNIYSVELFLVKKNPNRPVINTLVFVIRVNMCCLPYSLREFSILQKSTSDSWEIVVKYVLYV